MVREVTAMSRISSVCEKRPQVKNLVSHAKNRTKKWVYPNVHQMQYVYPGKERQIKRGKVCTKCVKAGKIVKIVSGNRTGIEGIDGKQ